MIDAVGPRRTPQSLASGSRFPIWDFELGPEWEQTMIYTCRPGNEVWVPFSRFRHPVDDHGGVLADAPDGELAVVGRVVANDLEALTAETRLVLVDARWYSSDQARGPLVTNDVGSDGGRLAAFEIYKACPVAVRQLTPEERARRAEHARALSQQAAVAWRRGDFERALALVDQGEQTEPSAAWGRRRAIIRISQAQARLPGAVTKSS